MSMAINIPKKESSRNFFDELTYFQSIALLLFILSAIGFVVFKDFLFLEKLYLFKGIGSDTVNSKYPLMVHVSSYLQEFGIPTWSFNQGMGQNILPARMKNPLYWFVYLSSPDSVGYKIVYVEYVKIILSGLFFFLYLNAMKVRNYPAVVGAMIYGFTGYMILGGGWYNYSGTVMFVALLLYAFELLFMKNKWYLFPLAVFFLADSRLYFFGMFLFLYSIFRFLDVYGFELREYCKLFVKMLGCSLLGVLLSLPFFVPLVLRILNSPRVSGDASQVNNLLERPVFGLESAHHYLTVIMRMFSNDILGSGMQFKGWYNYLEAPIFYCGLLVLLLVPQMFVFLKGRKKLLYAVFIGLWVLMIVFPYFRYAYSLFTGDYYKTALSYIFPFTLIFVGVHALNKIDELKKINVNVLVISLIVLLIFLNTNYSFEARQDLFVFLEDIVNKKIQLFATLFLIGYAGLILMFKYQRVRAFAQVGVFILLSVELGYFSYVTVNGKDAVSSEEYESRVGYRDYTMDALSSIKAKDKSFYRIDKGYSSGPAIHGSMNDALVQGFYGTPSYRAMNQGNYIHFLQELNVIEKGNVSHAKWAPGLARPLLKTFGSVKYYLSNQEDTHPFIKSTYHFIGQFHDVHAYENKYFLPLGFTYKKYIPKDKFDLLSSSRKDVALLSAFVIDDVSAAENLGLSSYDLNRLPEYFNLDNYRDSINALKKDVLNITFHGQKSIEGDIELQDSKMLFFSIPYDVGWKALVDGEDVKLEKVNIGFSGLYLPSGKHSVKLYYEIPYNSVFVSFSIIAGLLYLWLIFIARKKSQSQSQSQVLVLAT